jgi:hypothetical protein
METLFIYLLKKRLVTLFFWPTILLRKETFSPVIGFVGRFYHSFCLYWFSRRPFGGTNPQQSTGRKFPLVFPKPL